MEDKSVSISRNQLPELIYIMGTGRSGSTILEIVLANNPGMFGAGELFNLLTDGFIGNQECSCGRPFDDCEVWSKVEELACLSESESRRLAEKSRKLEWHKGFFRLISGRVRKEDEAEYAAHNLSILRYIKQATGARVIIDSSKYAGRALLLACAMPGKARVILLTRSPHGILASYRKRNTGEQPSASAFAVLLYIMYVTLCGWIASKKLGDRCMHVRYEDLQMDPIAELQRIENWGGYDLSSSKEILSRGGKLKVGHIVTGNRLRKQREVIFQRTAGTRKRPGFAICLIEGILQLWYRILSF